MAWGQQLELLSVLDLEEHRAYPVHARLQPAKGARIPDLPALDLADEGQRLHHAQL